MKSARGLAVLPVALVTALTGLVIALPTVARTPSAKAAPPTQRWHVDVGVGMDAGRPIAVAIVGRRVVVAGTGGPGDAITVVLHRASGAEMWTDWYDTGAWETAAALATDRRSVYLVGNVTDGENCSTYSSFVRALSIASGDPRWLASCAGPESPDESLYGTAIEGRRLFVVGEAGGNILVRAHRAGTGRVLWEDNVAPEFAISERATRVMVADGRLYVIGERHTVGGRTVVYVARAYDARTGKRLWENTFGGGLSFARSLGMARKTLIVAGSSYDIGSGNSQAEIAGLDPDTGAIMWMREPFSGPRADASSNTEALVTPGGTAVLAGVVTRSLTLPMLEAWGADGARRWSGEPTAAKYGHLNALATVGNTLLATGQGARKFGSRRRDLLLQSHDLRTGQLDWTTRLRLGLTDSEGVAIAAAGKDFVVAGWSLTVAGDRQWTVLGYRR